MFNSLLVKEENLSTYNGEIHLLTVGDPEVQPILFLHGITECAKAFLPVMERMPQEYYLVAADLRGRGESFKPSAGYQMDDYIEDLTAIFNKLISPHYKPIVVAHSMSARFATKFATQFPSLIEKLILVDPPISGPGRRAFPVPISRFLEPKKAIEENDELRFEQYYDANKIDISLKKYEMQHCLVEAIEQSYQSIANENFHFYFAQLSVPTLLLAANSPLITDEEYEELSKINSKVQLKRRREVGHEMFKENPDLFTDEILSYIRGEQSENQS